MPVSQVREDRIDHERDGLARFTSPWCRCGARPTRMTICDRACAMLREAAAKGAQVACLPELFRTQYFCQAEDAARFDLAEPIPGPTTEALAAVARETGMVVVGSIFEKRAPGVYHNTAVVLDADGTLRGRYRKMHIPDDPLYYEKYYFTPGDLGFKVFPTAVRPGGDAGLLGPVVSRGGPADGLEGGGDPLLSHGHRLASGRKGRVRRGPGQRLGDDAARATRSPTACTSRP